MIGHSLSGRTLCLTFIYAITKFTLKNPKPSLGIATTTLTASSMVVPEPVNNVVSFIPKTAIWLGVRLVARACGMAKDSFVKPVLTYAWGETKEGFVEVLGDARDFITDEAYNLKKNAITFVSTPRKAPAPRNTVDPVAYALDKVREAVRPIFDNINSRYLGTLAIGTGLTLAVGSAVYLSAKKLRAMYALKATEAAAKKTLLTNQVLETFEKLPRQRSASGVLSGQANH